MAATSELCRSLYGISCLLLLCTSVVGTGCEGEEGAESPTSEPEVSAEHPCADIALVQEQSLLWEDLIEALKPAPIPLLIPLEQGVSAEVSQGNAQGPTHLGTVAFAWDFVVDTGTRVVASAPGVVVWVRDDSSAHGEGEDALEDTNWIVVDHGAGLFSSYVHLEKGSALVEAGQHVIAGEALAETGLSGQLTGAHLHIQLENTWSASLPAAFVEYEGVQRCEWVPDVGDVVASAPDVAQHLVWRGQPSGVPTDTFAAYGVPELRGPQARLMSRSRPVEVTGRVDAGRKGAWLMLFPEEGGDAVYGLQMTVDGERIAGTLDLSDVAVGRYGWAVVAVGEGEAPSAPVAVRVSVID